MFKIGCHLSSSKGFEAMGKTAVALGATTFQFFTRNPRGSKAKEIQLEDVRRLLKMMKEHGMETIVAHAPYTMNVCSANEDTRAFGIRTMKEDLQRMELLPGQLYNFHPGAHTGQGMKEGINQIVQALNQCLTPQQTTTVLLETMAGKGTEVGGRFEELREILDGVVLLEKVGVCMDLCHVHDAGYDIVHQLDDVLDAFDRIIGLSKLKAVHINDSKNPLGSHKDRHEKIGKGFLGLETICKVINHPRIKDLPFILETPNELEGYAAEIMLLKQNYKG